MLRSFAQSAVGNVRGLAAHATLALLCLMGCHTNRKSNDQILVLATAKDRGTFDPAQIVPLEWTPLAQIYETLVVWDGGQEFLPGLATHWERDDALNWTFQLRRNVRFHDGAEFNAEAVKFSLERFRQLRGVWQRLDLTAITALDAHTIRLTTRTPFAPLPAYLSYLNFAIVSPRATDLKTQPAGTGPFQLADYAPQERAVLARFEHYWGERARLAQVIYRFLPDAQTQLLALEAGEVDACRAVPLPEVARLQARTDIRVVTGAGRHTHYLAFNRKASSFREEFDDIRFRRALHLATDRAALVRLALAGNGETAAKPVPDWLLPNGLSVPHPAFDLAQARALLAECGWADRDGDSVLEKDGRALRLRLVYSPAWLPQNTTMVETMQAQWRQVGIDLQLRSLEWGAADRAEQTGEADLRHRASTFALGGLHFGLLSDYHSRYSAAKSIHYRNAAVDDLLLHAEAADSPAQAQASYQQILRLLQQDVPVIALYHEQEIIARRSNLRGDGLKPHPAIYPLPLLGLEKY